MNDVHVPGPVYKPRLLMNQHFSSTASALGAGPFTTISFAWADVIYGGIASPELGPFPLSTRGRLVRWAAVVTYLSGGGGTGGWQVWFFKNGAVAATSAFHILPVGATPQVIAGRPSSEFDIIPGVDHWGVEFQNPAADGGIGVAIVRLCCTFEVL